MSKKKPEMVRGSSSIKRGTRIIRSTDHGCYKIFESSAWGKYLVPVDDPEGVKLSKFERTGIQLKKSFPKIPVELWSRYISLCFYMCPEGKQLSSSFHDSQLEVQVCLLRDTDTLSKWKIVVPKQIVSGVSVKAELAKCIDIETGERYEQFPPPGWVHAGSSHSHNTMDAFFSATDDKSELTVPGLHIVVGNIDHKKKEYTYRASVVLQKLRKEVDLDDVVDAEPGIFEFHQDVLEYIQTVVSANKKLYEDIKSKKKKKGASTTSMKDATEDNPLLDDSEAFANFMQNLDVTDMEDFEAGDFFIDEEIAATVDEWIEQGVPPEIILRSVEHVVRQWDNFVQAMEAESEV